MNTISVLITPSIELTISKASQKIYSEQDGVGRDYSFSQRAMVLPKKWVKKSLVNIANKNLKKPMQNLVLATAKGFGDATIEYIRKKMREKKTGREYYIPEYTTIHKKKKNERKYIASSTMSKYNKKRKLAYLQEQTAQVKISNRALEKSGNEKLKSYITNRDKSLRQGGNRRDVIGKNGINKGLNRKKYRASAQWTKDKKEYPAIRTGYLYRGMYYTLKRVKEGYRVTFIFEPDYALPLMGRGNGSLTKGARPFFKDAVAQMRIKYKL